MTVECRVCRSARLERFLDLGDQPHGDSLLTPETTARREPSYPLQAFFCLDCTTMQIGHTVPKETMFAEYLYVSGTTEALRAHFRASTRRLVEKLKLGSGDLVVDIGSNDGTWLSCWKESAANLAAMAAAAGAETVNRFFNEGVAREILETHGAPRLVTAAGVFFHLEELHSATKGIAALCGETGVFCVQAIYLGEIIRLTQFDNIYHEHLTYWSLKSIEKLFSIHGLEVFSAKILPIHGGSLELLAAKKGSRPVEPSVQELRRAEAAAGLDRIETYRDFGERVWKIKDELLSILKRFTDAGKTLQAFGAPAKGATLLNSFGITSRTVPCAVERNPLKFGKLIPGARIPIVDEAGAEAPDAYLVLPWNFLQEFLRKKKDFILGGGAFIVPIPRPVVIDRSNYSDFLD
jgi:hypothetical protein